MGDRREPDQLARPEIAPRHRGVRPVFLLMLALALAVVVLVTIQVRGEAREARPGRVPVDWFAANKAHCNAVEVHNLLALTPPPHDIAGAAQGAACLAIAGNVAAARELIQRLPASQAGSLRSYAANYVFQAAHPVADAGDDESAGPIMELVVEFIPDQYMALYHAGMARAITGDDERARTYLTRFLELYRQPDGWNQNARRALEALDRPRAQRTVKQGSEGSIIY